MTHLHKACAEWQPQDATLLVWPHHSSDWQPRLASITLTYLHMTAAISNHQLVIIIVQDEQHMEITRTQCVNHGCQQSNIEFLIIPTNDTWIRDYGPQLITQNKDCIFLDFDFNAWGEQYSHHLDQAFAHKLWQQLSLDKYEYKNIPVVYEGGNLDFDSCGNILTNLKCAQRNSSKFNHDEDVINLLKTNFNCKRVIGLHIDPLAGDDTGGHIDTLARFINDNTIIYATSSHPEDPNYSVLECLRAQLMNLQEQYNYTLIPLNMPNIPLIDTLGQMLPASYINFVLINDGVLVPQYQDQQDSNALTILQTCYPSREIIPINACELVQQFGSLHCATLHIPASTL